MFLVRSCLKINYKDAAEGIKISKGARNRG